jgi:hypothetical protein
MSGSISFSGFTMLAARRKVGVVLANSLKRWGFLILILVVNSLLFWNCYLCSRQLRIMGSSFYSQFFPRMASNLVILIT